MPIKSWPRWSGLRDVRSLDYNVRVKRAPKQPALRSHSNAKRLPKNLLLSVDESLADYIDQQGVGPGSTKLAQFRTAMILRGTPALCSQDARGDEAIACVKLFDPCGSASWYVLEWDGQDEAFGYVTGLGHNELGYLSLRELAETPGPLCIGIEVDTHFHPMTLSMVKAL